MLHLRRHLFRHVVLSRSWHTYVRYRTSDASTRAPTSPSKRPLSKPCTENKKHEVWVDDVRRTSKHRAALLEMPYFDSTLNTGQLARSDMLPLKKKTPLTLVVTRTNSTYHFLPTGTKKYLAMNRSILVGTAAKYCRKSSTRNVQTTYQSISHRRPRSRECRQFSLHLCSSRLNRVKGIPLFTPASLLLQAFAATYVQPFDTMQ